MDQAGRSGVRHIEQGWVSTAGCTLGVETIAYQAWLAPGVGSVQEASPEKRILAYPGWLDNSGSFAPLAPILAENGYCVVALDPPGCGRSSHRSAAAFYHDFEECVLIPQVADRIGWKEPFIMMGHSRGSNISISMCGAMPHRVRACILIESSLGMAGTYISNRPELGDKRVFSFRNCLTVNKRNRGRPTKVFKSMQEAVDHNQQNPIFPKSRAVSEAIVARHVAPVDASSESLTFIHDTRTYGQVQSRFIDFEANLRFLENVQCPVLLLAAREATILDTLPGVHNSLQDAVNVYAPKMRRFGPMPRNVVAAHVQDMYARVGAIKDFTYFAVKGRHHMHGDEPAECAGRILPWIEQALRRAVLPDVPKSFPAPNSIVQSSVRYHLDAMHEKEEASGDTCAKERTPSPLEHELVLEINGMTVACKVFGDAKLSDKKKRAVALCSQLDNAASWSRLAEKVCGSDSDACVCAIDPPFLGRSRGNVPRDAAFGSSELAALVIDVAEQLGWVEDRLHLWGHGTASETMLFLAGSIPERVASVVLFDPCAGQFAGSLPHAMCEYYEGSKRDEQLPPLARSFEAIALRIQRDPLFPKSPQTALLLAERCAVSEPDGLWRRGEDSRVWNTVVPGGLPLTPGAYREALGSISASVFVILPDRSPFARDDHRKRLEEELSWIPSVEQVSFQGNSHSHSCQADNLFPVVCHLLGSPQATLSDTAFPSNLKFGPFFFDNSKLSKL